MSCNVYPNPFNNSISIEYQLKENTSATLTLFNHLGQEVGLLADEQQTKGPIGCSGKLKACRQEYTMSK